MEPAKHIAAASTAIDRIVFVIAKLLQNALWPNRHLNHQDIHLFQHRLRPKVARPCDIALGLTD
jgi:hypothetical protein